MEGRSRGEGVAVMSASYRDRLQEAAEDFTMWWTLRIGA